MHVSCSYASEIPLAQIVLECVLVDAIHNAQAQEHWAICTNHTQWNQSEQHEIKNLEHYKRLQLIDRIYTYVRDGDSKRRGRV